MIQAHFCLAQGSPFAPHAVPHNAATLVFATELLPAKLHEAAIANSYDDINEACRALAAEIMFKIVRAEVFDCLNKEVEHYIIAEFNTLRERVHAEIDAMSATLGREITKFSGSHAASYYWEDMIDNAKRTKRAASILNQHSAGLNLVVQTLDDALAFIPLWIRQIKWTSYVICAPAVGLFANFFFCRTMIALGCSSATIIFALVVLVTNVVACGFYVWAVTGRLYRLDLSRDDG